jgi:hypothetical protein
MQCSHKYKDNALPSLPRVPVGFQNTARCARAEPGAGSVTSGSHSWERMASLPSTLNLQTLNPGVEAPPEAFDRQDGRGTGRCFRSRHPR